MRIKLAILDRDRNYLEKMNAAFVRQYPGEIDFYLFTAKPAALALLSSSEVDVFLLNKSIDLSPEEIPENCVYAYLSDDSVADRHLGRPVIFKYQRMDLIYKQIRSLRALGGQYSDCSGSVILFCGASGGMGTSTAAAACAIRFHKQQKKVLYLNLQKFSGADLYFSGEGQKGLSDLISSLQNPEENLRILLQNWVREDKSGVYFYSQAKSPLDMEELGPGGILRLISELKHVGIYDYIILDMDLSLDRALLPVYRAADKIILVGDRSEASSAKADRVLRTFKALDIYNDVPLINRVSFLYNRVCCQDQKDIHDQNIHIWGSIGCCRKELAGNAPKCSDIVDHIAKLDLFDSIM